MEAAGGLWQRLSGPEERRLLDSLSYGMVGMGALSALLLRFVRMPYGRYSTRRLGCLVPARLAWPLQELPALLVPLGLSLFSGAARVSEWPNRVLLALFIGHYAHRLHTTASMEPTQLIDTTPYHSKHDHRSDHCSSYEHCKHHAHYPAVYAALETSTADEEVTAVW